MKTVDYRANGICARAIRVILDDNDVVQQVLFDGGCDGNHKGIDALCRGMKADEVISRLEGVTCGFKSTSCPDQLAQALKTR